MWNDLCLIISNIHTSNRQRKHCNTSYLFVFVDRLIPCLENLFGKKYVKGSSLVNKTMVIVIAWWYYNTFFLNTLKLIIDSLPFTVRKTEKLILGSVLTWHWYSPASLSWVYLICKAHEFESEAWWALNLWSPVNVNTSLVKTWRSDLRIHDTWNNTERKHF